MKNIQHEITPINEDDLFIILNHPKADFDYPIHFHSDFHTNGKATMSRATMSSLYNFTNSS